MENHKTVLPRILAFILDNILLLPPLMVIAYWVRGLNLQPEILIAFLFLINLALSVYFIVMHAISGQTVGKILMKVKVLDISGLPLTFRQAVLRDLPQILLLIASFIFENPLKITAETDTEMDILNNPIRLLAMIWGITDIIFFFITNRHRALHDFIAGTVVVRVEETE